MERITRADLKRMIARLNAMTGQELIIHKWSSGYAVMTTDQSKRFGYYMTARELYKALDLQIDLAETCWLK